MIYAIRLLQTLQIEIIFVCNNMFDALHKEHLLSAPLDKFNTVNDSVLIREYSSSGHEFVIRDRNLSTKYKYLIAEAKQIHRENIINELTNI